MKFLSKDDTYGWFREHGFSVDSNGLPRSERELISESIESDTGKRIYQTKEKLKAFGDKKEVLLFFTDWSIWSREEEMNIFDRVSISFGEERPLIERPGHVFERKEFSSLTTFALLGSLFLWDMYVLGDDKNDFVFFSHDEFIDYATVK